MKTSEIKVGGHYAYAQRPNRYYGNSLIKVEVEEIGVERQRATRGYWAASRSPLHDGILCKVIDPNYNSYWVIARPAQLVREWAELEASRALGDRLVAEQQRREQAAAEANRPVLEQVRATLNERGFTAESYTWGPIFDDDNHNYAAQTHSVSVSLSLRSLAKLLGIEGEVHDPIDFSEVATERSR